VNPLASRRCHVHRGREAAARCPVCGRFFCRECVTEHDGRLLCAACLQRAADGGGVRRAAWESLAAAGELALGTFLIWVVFYRLGRLLLTIPSEFFDPAALRVW
jgi:hypothetical protein